MRIKFKTQPAPTIPASVAEELARNYPLVLPRWYKDRWQVWIKLEHNSHPMNRFARSERDLYLDGSWYRFLQTWCFVDERGLDRGYAPIDQRFLRSLRLVDVFLNRRWFEDNIETPEQQKEVQELLQVKEAAADSERYYSHFDSPIIAPYIKGGSDWRHKIR